MSDHDDCGGCAGRTTATPVLLDNRPGLSAIRYRVGTWADFFASMQVALSDPARRLVDRFGSRDPDDPTIALLDAWAVVADVLTFYQERIANETYLRTATERASVLELARAIGYELRPGVAAGVSLAFTLEEGKGAPAAVEIPAGTRVQSVPGPGELPQVFETAAALAACGHLNALRPRPTRPTDLERGLKRICVRGTATNLRPGDAIVIVGDEREADPTSDRWDFRRLTAVEPDVARDLTRLTWKEGLGWKRFGKEISPAVKNPAVYAFRQRVALFGAAAPEFRLMPRAIQNAALGLADNATPSSAQLGEWPGLSIRALAGGTGLRGEYYDGVAFGKLRFTRIDPTIDFIWNTGGPGGGVGSNEFSIRWTGFVRPLISGTYGLEPVSDDGVRLWIGDESVTRENARTGFHMIAGVPVPIRIEYERGGTGRLELRWRLDGGTATPIPKECLLAGDPRELHLDARYPQIAAGSWIVLANPAYDELYKVLAADEDARTGFTLTAKTTRLTLSGERLIAEFDDAVRSTTVFGHSERMDIVEEPWPDPVEGAHVELDRRVPPLEPGRLLIVTGLDFVDGTARTEEVELERAEDLAGHTHLTFTDALRHRYRRDSVVILANVARATHGETVAGEVLGSGNAALDHQRFTLRQGPLTHVSGAGGLRSSLDVRVDGVLWRQVPSLYGRGPRERVYVARTDDDGKTTIQFGDGEHGARLPTGGENVRADYRKGIGRVGLVQAEQLTLLMTRPLGVRGVRNPLPASGAEDRQSLGDARNNAPRSIVTLGRIVSLRDFADFAADYPGIGKALASWVWYGDARGVLLTVAGIDGAAVLEESALAIGLHDEIRRAAEDGVRFAIKSYRPVSFTVDADFRVAPDRIAADVAAAVANALRARFSFAARDFGAAVSRSEVIAAIQNVPGVVMVDLNRIAREGYRDFTGRDHYLPAHAPRPGDDVRTALPAELLTIGSLSNLTVIP